VEDEEASQTSKVMQLINMQHFLLCSTLTSASHLNGTIYLYNLISLDCISFLSLSDLQLLSQRWYRKYAAAMGKRAEAGRDINLYCRLCD